MQGGGYLAMNRIPILAATSGVMVPSSIHQSCENANGKQVSVAVEAKQRGSLHCKGSAALSGPLRQQLPQQDAACPATCQQHVVKTDDADCLAPAVGQAVHFYCYHIIYLPSYSVPVLLFNGWHEGMWLYNKTLRCLYFGVALSIS